MTRRVLLLALAGWSSWAIAARAPNLQQSRFANVKRPDGGITHFLPPGANLEKRLSRNPGGQPRKLLYVIFAGGAGKGMPPENAARVSAIARAFGRAANSGKFGEYSVAVIDGAARGYPDLAIKAFYEVAPHVTTIGFSPTSTPQEYLKSGAPIHRDYVLLSNGMPYVVDATAASPAYIVREIAMIQRRVPTVLVTLGGRFGTASEAAIALDAGKVVAFSRGTDGISNVFDQIVKTATRAGKPPLAPVIVSPDFSQVDPAKLEQLADRYVDKIITLTLKRLAQGPMGGHIEAGNISTSRMVYMRLTPSERR